MPNSIISLILINQRWDIPKCILLGTDRQNFWLATFAPPNGAEIRFFHLVRPAGHFRYPAPKLRLLSSIISLILINQGLGHPKMRFSGFRPTEFPLSTPPKTVPKMGSFTSRARQGASGTHPS